MSYSRTQTSRSVFRWKSNAKAISRANGLEEKQEQRAYEQKEQRYGYGECVYC